MSGRRYQRGASSVIAMLVASGAMMAMLAWYIGYSGREMSRMNAIQAGREFAQVTSAIRVWIGDGVRRMKAYHGVDVEALGLTGPSLWYELPPEGLSFLRDCVNPVSERALLDCSIANYADGNETPYGSRYRVQVRFTPALGALGGFLVEVRAFYTLPGYIEHRAELASLIADAAYQAVGGQDPYSKTPAIGSFYQYSANASEDALPLGVSPMPDPAHLGKVMLYARNDPTKDAWLRVDGTNKMLKELNAGGFSLVNVKDLEAANNGYFGNSVVAGADLGTLNGNVTAGNHASSDPTNPVGWGDGIGEIFADNVAVGDVTLSDRATHPRVSQGIYDARMVKHEEFVPEPICGPGSTPQIFAVPTSFASRLKTDAVHAVNTKVQAGTGPSGEPGWTVLIEVLVATGGGWVDPDDATIRRAVVFTKCS